MSQVDASARNAWKVARPSTTGIIQSRSTASGWCSRASSMAAAPPPAAMTSQPDTTSRAICVISRIESSSSTTRTVGTAISPPGRRRGDSRVKGTQVVGLAVDRLHGHVPGPAEHPGGVVAEGEAVVVVGADVPPHDGPRLDEDRAHPVDHRLEDVALAVLALDQREPDVVDGVAGEVVGVVVAEVRRADPRHRLEVVGERREPDGRAVVAPRDVLLHPG